MREVLPVEAAAQGTTASLRRVVATTATLALVAALPVSVTGPISLPIRRDLALSNARFGLMLASFAFGVATCAIPSGRLLERASIRVGLRAALVLTALSALGAAASTGWLMLATSMYIAGVGAAVNDVALASWISRSVPPPRQGLTLGLKYASVPTAAMLGGIAVPTVALTLGWRWVFVAVTLSAAAAWSLVPSDIPRSSSPRSHEPRKPISPRVYVLAASLAVGQMPLLFFSGFIVTTAVRTGINQGLAGLLFAGCAVCGIVARVASGRAADRRRHALVNVIVANLVAGSGALALASIDSPLTVTLAMLVGFTSLFAWQGLVVLLVVRIPGAAVARAFSLLTLGAGTGTLTGPIIFGAVYDHSSSWAWLAASAAPLIAATGMLISGAMTNTARTHSDPIAGSTSTAALPPAGN